MFLYIFTRTWVWEQDAAGSSPVISTKRRKPFGFLLFAFEVAGLKGGIRGRMSQAETEKTIRGIVFDVFSTADTRFLTTEWEAKNHGIKG